MKHPRLLTILAFCLAVPAFAQAEATAPAAEAATVNDAALLAAVNGAWRSDEAKSRDRYRHPVEALAFWGLKPGMTVLEIQPGAGWWTDILAPYARATGGRYYATAADISNPKLPEGARKARAAFEQRLAAQPEVYGKVELVNWGDGARALPANTFDFILTARNVHGWMQDKPGTVETIFKAFHDALKPGGILAIEQHRANPTDGAEQPGSGYVTEKYVIEQAQKAGFTLVAKSEINANPKDTKDHPFGVWTLPPALRSTPYGSSERDPGFDHSRYLAIGESDRMTLKFVRN